MLRQRVTEVPSTSCRLLARRAPCRRSLTIGGSRSPACRSANGQSRVLKSKSRSSAPGSPKLNAERPEWVELLMVFASPSCRLFPKDNAQYVRPDVLGSLQTSSQYIATAPSARQCWRRHALLVLFKINIRGIELTPAPHECGASSMANALPMHMHCAARDFHWERDSYNGWRVGDNRAGLNVCSRCSHS